MSITAYHDLTKEVIPHSKHEVFPYMKKGSFTKGKPAYRLQPQRTKRILGETDIESMVGGREKHGREEGRREGEWRKM